MTQEVSLETARTKRVKIITVVIVALLASSFGANWLLYKKWVEAKALATRSFDTGYLAARINYVRGVLSMPSLTEINFEITRLRATSAQLGFANPDTLKFYGIIPWEEYPLKSMSVAEHANWTRRRAR